MADEKRREQPAAGQGTAPRAKDQQAGQAAQPGPQAQQLDPAAQAAQPGPQAQQAGHDPGLGAEAQQADPAAQAAKGGKRKKGDKKKAPIEMMEAPKVQPVWKRILIIIVSNFIMALSLTMFTQSANILPAGFSGLTILLQEIFSTAKGIALPFGPINIAFNVIPAIIAMKMVGKKFVAYSFLSVLIFSLMVDALPILHMTDQMILVVIFGAVIYGGGLALLMQANASAGGTDFISISLSEKYGINFFPYTFLINVVILACSIPYFGVDAALYSMVFQFLCTAVFGKLYSRYQKTTLLIIADQPEPISRDLMKMTNHGITAFTGTGMYTGNQKYLLYIVVSKGEVSKVKKYLDHTDAKVFMNVLESDQLSGNFYMQPYE